MIRLPPCVNNILLQIQQIDVLLAIDDHVKLMRFKNRQQIMRNNLIETILQILDHLDDASRTIMLTPTIDQ